MEVDVFSRRSKSVAAIAAAALSVTFMTTSAPAATAAGTKTIRVWLMPDAKNFGTALADANAAFTKAHPGYKVAIEYQTWGDHLKKLDAALVARNTPDVVEFGNTEVLKYSASGALQDLTKDKAKFANSANWLQGLTEAGSYNGKLFAVPYYAGTRAVMYRPSLFAAAGVTDTPKTYAQFFAAADALMAKYGSDPEFSAVFLPGKYWYAAMSFVYDAGGKIAVKKGNKWVGTLNSSSAIAGLSRFKEISDKFSRADKSGTEAAQWEVFNGGKVAMSYSNGWESCCIPKIADDWAFFPMPSVTKGKFAPTFLGGSNLAVPAFSKNAALGKAWIQTFTNAKNMKTIALSGAIPNNTKMLNLISGKAAPIAQAANRSWFVPAATKWIDVENANVLQTMLSDIASGKASVTAAAEAASDQITQILNG